MATYNNLASLNGLAVNDVVTYTAGGMNGAYSIDFAKYKVRVELHGNIYTSSIKGGLTIFDFDTSGLTSTAFTYSSYRGGSTLIYGTYTTSDINSTNAYNHRVGVAGLTGTNAKDGSAGGKGGGLTGSSGSDHGGGGGTQTAGGSKGDWLAAGTAGSFGTGGSGGSVGSGRGGSGGAGWYGGGGGSETGGGGGGSGFIIGNSTTTYPSGYMDNNTTLKNQLIAAISNASTTQGAATAIEDKVGVGACKIVSFIVP